MPISNIARAFDFAPKVDFWSLRFVESRSDEICVRQNILQPKRSMLDSGVMAIVYDGGGSAYVSISDFSESGIRSAFELAKQKARANAKFALVNSKEVKMPDHSGSYESPTQVGWESWSLRQKIELVENACIKLKMHENIVDWEASLWHTQVSQRYINKLGADITQEFDYMVPNLSATAHHNGITQVRTLNGRGMCRQGGLELLSRIAFVGQAYGVANDALQLVNAPNCPEGKMDLLLDPDQMMLQIHESIGHPLELDRILGDERNYAGTSFVTLDMFGKYQYGSDLLNVTFDPTLKEQFASYAFDDNGSKAQKTFIIKNGVLQRPLGSHLSQQRTNQEGVANARASNWNRPPIDRMANLNLEPGSSSMDEMIESVERGIYMKANTSWSIDDSRNKFQFGCEWAQLIENGKLTKVVRNPNYRGISATFWRSLKAVGDQETFGIYGTPYCGKGEPNQAIRVGHASPACLFANVDVFGGV